MLFEDTPYDYWSDSKFDSNTRLLGKDWPSLAFSMIGSVRMRNLRYACETVVLDGVVGDFIETGVWRGAACIMMRGILDLYGIWHMAYGDNTRRTFLLTVLLDFRRRPRKIFPMMRVIVITPSLNSRYREPMSRTISAALGYWTNGSFSLRVGSRIRCQTLRSIS
jgi:hypothetical protein